MNPQTAYNVNQLPCRLINVLQKTSQRLKPIEIYWDILYVSKVSLNIFPLRIFKFKYYKPKKTF